MTLAAFSTAIRKSSPRQIDPVARQARAIRKAIDTRDLDKLVSCVGHARRSVKGSVDDSVLCYAALQGWLPGVMALLPACPLQLSRWKALVAAAVCGNVTMVELLLPHASLAHDAPKFTPSALLDSVAGIPSSEPAVEFLLRHIPGPWPPQDEALMSAIYASAPVPGVIALLAPLSNVEEVFNQIIEGREKSGRSLSLVDRLVSHLPSPLLNSLAFQLSSSDPQVLARLVHLPGLKACLEARLLDDQMTPVSETISRPRL